MVQVVTFPLSFLILLLWVLFSLVWLKFCRLCLHFQSTSSRLQGPFPFSSCPRLVSSCSSLYYSLPPIWGFVLFLVPLGVELNCLFETLLFSRGRQTSIHRPLRAALVASDISWCCVSIAASARMGVGQGTPLAGAASRGPTRGAGRVLAGSPAPRPPPISRCRKLSK